MPCRSPPQDPMHAATSRGILRGGGRHGVAGREGRHMKVRRWAGLVAVLILVLAPCSSDKKASTSAGLSGGSSSRSSSGGGAGNVGAQGDGDPGAVGGAVPA